jgi:hypothetical protein
MMLRGIGGKSCRSDCRPHRDLSGSPSIAARRWPTANPDVDANISTITLSRRRLILAAIMLATFMAAVETTIVATAVPAIVADIGHSTLLS